MPARRFLAPAARQGTGSGYYSQPQRPITQSIADNQATIERVASFTAMCDEPEAPSRDWVDAAAELAAEYNRLRLLKEVQIRRENRAGVSLENRIRDAQRRAKAQRVSISRPLFVIRQQLARGNTPVATGKLEALEAMLDGVPQGAVA